MPAPTPSVFIDVKTGRGMAIIHVNELTYIALDDSDHSATVALDDSGVYDLIVALGGTP